MRTPEEREQAEAALKAAQDAQTAYWEALSALESALYMYSGDEVDVSGVDDLESASIETLLDTTGS
jgi:hypothetical protein